MQQTNKRNRGISPAERLGTALLFLLLVMLLPGLRGFGQDNEFFTQWAQYTRAQGLKNAYGSGTDYLPLYQYVLWGYGKIVGAAAITAQLHYLRVFAMFFDFFGVFILWKWLRGSWSFVAVLLLTIGNVAYSYNSLIWGQVDAVWTALSFAALYFACQKQFACSAACVALALCTKLQAIIFLPLWGVCMLNGVLLTDPRQRWRNLSAATLTLIATPALLILPFAFGKGGVNLIAQVIRLASGRFPLLTLSADNLWSWHGAVASDNDLALPGMSYKEVGLLLFCTGSLLALWPLIAQFIRNLRARREYRRGLSPEMVWLSGALVSLFFFYCNTEMHERYAHPAGIFLAAYAIQTGRWWHYALFSVAYFLNLEIIMRWLALPNYGTLIFHPRFVSALFGLTIICLAYELWRCQRKMSHSTPATQQVPHI